MSWVVWVQIGVSLLWFALFRMMTRELNMWSDLAKIEMDLTLAYARRAAQFAINRVEFGNEEALAWLDAEEDEFHDHVTRLMAKADKTMGSFKP